VEVSHALASVKERLNAADVWVQAADHGSGTTQMPGGERQRIGPQRTTQKVIQYASGRYQANKGKRRGGGPRHTKTFKLRITTRECEAASDEELGLKERLKRQPSRAGRMGLKERLKRQQSRAGRMCDEL
jgi:hypothetical protein